MKIITNRSIQLDGKHVEFGVPTEVSKDTADLAISRGWAIAAPAKAGKAEPEKTEKDAD